MEVLKYDSKKEILIIEENNKKKKYNAVKIHSQNGFSFLLCRKYALNIFCPSDEQGFYRLFSIANLDIYFTAKEKNMDISFPFKDEKEKFIAIDKNGNFYENGQEIIESFVLAMKLAK